jgi:hypothetical protein
MCVHDTHVNLHMNVYVWDVCVPAREKILYSGLRNEHFPPDINTHTHTQSTENEMK